MFRAQGSYFEGMFIKKSTRIVVILHLSFVFWYLLWVCLQPTAIDYWEKETHLELYEYAMGNFDIPHEMHDEERVEAEGLKQRNQARFLALSPEMREEIQEGHAHVKYKPSPPFKQRFEEVVQLLAYHVPPFVRAWIFFSLATCLMLLLHIEGALQAAWILPVVIAAYSYVNFYFGMEPIPQVDADLFPSEKVIVEKYLKEPLSSKISAQRDQLMRGWHLYLVQVWAEAAPSSDPQQFQKQVEEGEYRFNLKRITLRNQSKHADASHRLNEKESPILLALYMIWNLFFALFVNRRGALYEEEPESI